ncbi:hypothetical protein BASA81_004473 [Batrachochytrium salamandrivorans]|nr:hypothetical protein BASA81_004473 [Batrachochytrium salamandrivorans]
MDRDQQPPLGKWKQMKHGDGLWFRAHCSNQHCEARNRLIIADPFTGLDEYVWKLPPPRGRSQNQNGKSPSSSTATTALECRCCCCGKVVMPVEANLTNCFYRLDGEKIVGLERVKLRGKWTESNSKTRRSCWEEVNGLGGLGAKWHSLTIHVQVGGIKPVDLVDWLFVQRLFK